MRRYCEIRSMLLDAFLYDLERSRTLVKILGVLYVSYI